MILVDENRAWAALARRRCEVAAEIGHEVLPFDRPGCYFDELLMAVVLVEAKDQLADVSDMFAAIAARHGTPTTRGAGALDD